MKLKINVDTLDPKSCAQLAALGAALAGTSTQTISGTMRGKQADTQNLPVTEEIKEMLVVSEEVKPTPEEIAKQKKIEAAEKRKATAAKKKEEAAAAKLKAEQEGNDESTSAKETAEQTDTQADPSEESAEGSTAEVTKTMLQTLIRTKSTEKNEVHRPALKKELARLGAKNVSTLEEKDYAEFHAFMTAL